MVSISSENEPPGTPKVKPWGAKGLPPKSRFCPSWHHFGTTLESFWHSGATWWTSGGACGRQVHQNVNFWCPSGSLLGALGVIWGPFGGCWGHFALIVESILPAGFWGGFWDRFKNVLVSFWAHSGVHLGGYCTPKRSWRFSRRTTFGVSKTDGSGICVHPVST